MSCIAGEAGHSLAMLRLTLVGEIVGQEDQEKHFRFKDKNRFKVKELEEMYYANSSPKRAGVFMLTLVKVDFKTNLVTRENERHFVAIKVSIVQEDITILSTYTNNNKVLK